MAQFVLFLVAVILVGALGTAVHAGDLLRAVAYGVGLLVCLAVYQYLRNADKGDERS